MENEFYHVLNRGVDKRTIFMDEGDHLRFIHDLYEFNDEQNTYTNNYRFQRTKYLDIGCPNIRNRERLVTIHAFAMMPNHYHILLSPIAEDGIPRFMKKLNMGYAKYFNEKNKRVGALFQGKYKSVHIQNERHFLYLPYYIHLNPLDLAVPEWRKRNIFDKGKAVHFLKEYRWSSHLDYLGEKNFPSVTDRKFLLEFFGGTTGYAKAFAQELENFSMDKIGGNALEDVWTSMSKQKITHDNQ
jgi:putative transposase